MTTQSKQAPGPFPLIEFVEGWPQSGVIETAEQLEASKVEASEHPDCHVEFISLCTLQAAPKMLEELKAALWSLEHPEAQIQRVACITAARAAIAKAEGRA